MIVTPEQARPGRLPSVAEFLDFPETRLGRPEVLAGADSLGRLVRWLHISELTDLAGMLQGGELILTTGISLPTDTTGLRDYVVGLDEAGVVAIALEVGRRFDRVPPALVRACERLGMPLIVLRRRVAFVKITEAVQSRIFDAQLADLRFSEHVHTTFTRLSLAEATMYKIVKTVSQLADGPVVFENLLHRVLAYEPHEMPTEDLLGNWETRSRATGATRGTQVAGPELWLVTPVVVRGQAIGRLVLLTQDEPTATQSVVLERGAIALMLKLAYHRTSEQAEDDAETSAIADLITRRHCGEQQMSARLAALGVPITARRIFGVVMEVRTKSGIRLRLAMGDSVLEQLRVLASRTATRILASPALGGRMAVLLSCAPHDSPERFLTGAYEMLGALQGDHRVVLAAGPVATTVAEICGSFSEAIEVTKSVSASSPDRPFYDMTGVRIRGLFSLLQDEPRVHAFVERSLGPLLEFDARHDTEYFASLCAFLEGGQSKAAAAKALAVSRQTMYERLSTIERVLGVNLTTDHEACASLHAAIIAFQVLGPVRAVNERNPSV